MALDTEFPGVVARPIGEFKSTADYQYQLLRWVIELTYHIWINVYLYFFHRCNVDLLKIIQIGLSFFNKEGDMPEGVCSWQFNFKFNLSEDM